MRALIRLALAAALGLMMPMYAAPRQAPTFRLLSWNVAGMSPVERADSFRGHLRLAAADILLLDEVEGRISEAAFRQALTGPKAAEASPWHLLWGARGGRQRIVMAARSPLSPIDAFQTNDYDPADVAATIAAAPEDARADIRRDMAAGLPVNAATVQIAGRRLLLVGFDLQCCGEQWQQVRRLAEVRHIRRLTDEAIRASGADGVILAGDLNLAAAPAGAAGIGALPLVVLSGPYRAPVDGLIAAEAVQRDGREVWTINSGDRSQFPHMPFDFQLYSPRTLRVARAEVMDTADYPAAELARGGLTATSSREFSDHLPVVVTYEWKPRR